MHCSNYFVQPLPIYITINVFMYFTVFHELNRSHLMVHCQASEARFQFKGNLEVTCRNDGCCYDCSGPHIVICSSNFTELDTMPI